MRKFLFDLYSLMTKRKFLSAGIAIAMVLFLGFFASRISFQENINQLIPSNDQSGVTSKVLDQVNFADKITIIISSKNNGSPENLTEYANAFIDSLDANCKPFVAKVQGKIEEENIQETFDFVYANLPLFLDEKDYALIQNKLQKDSIANNVAADYKSILSPAGLVSKDFILRDPLGISFIALKKMQQLSVGDDFAIENGFILTKDNQHLLLFVTPKLATNETDKNTIFITNIEKIRINLNQQFKGKVEMTYFGATPVAVANATQIKADVQNTSIFAGVTLILLLAFFYRSLSTPIIIFIPSLLGALFALTVLYFCKGTISAISLGISSILLGETTDYSIYVLTHLRNNKDVKLLYKDITKPLLLCGITTSITFLCLFLIKSEALQDLGIFASLSVVSTSVFSLVLIPVLYKKNTKLFVPKANFIDKLGGYSYHKNKFLIGSMLLLLIVCLFAFSKVTFNNDLSALNFMTPKLKMAEKQLDHIANSDSSKSIYLATYGKSYNEVVANNNILFGVLEKDKKANGILNFSSIGGIVFSAEVQKKKIAEWNTFWSSEKKSNLTQSLISEGNRYGFKATTFTSFYELLNKKFNPITINEYLKVKSFFLDEFIAQKNGFYTISTLVKVPVQKRDVFVNQIKKQPNLVVIDRQQTNETFLGTLKTNFEDLVNYSFIAVFFVLLLAFRKVELAIISIIPILISWIFTSGLMGMFGLQFNVVNIIVCTLIFGIGVDYSIFMTSALQKEYTFGKIELPSYRTSILLSVATTILGIGVLIFAKHPALKSISLIAIIGIFSALMITFILQPLVFHFFVTNRVKKGKAPYEIRRLLHSLLSFTYFGLGGFLLSILSWILMTVLPFSKRSKLMAFHFILSKFMHSVLMTYPSLKRKIINMSNEKFDKPAVIIANHSSFLDILAIGMLSPKIIFLVSDWVYNSPVFGKGVRLAGFYPVSSGMDNGVDHLRTKVKEGFSIMVFPEGTRSEDNSIKRFHKGAFYLAEQLQLDIVPVVIHGYSEVLPKGDFVINGGNTTVTILDRISYDDIAFGTDLAERTKKISTFFKLQFKKMRLNLEGVDYFRKKLINSYAFKESQVVQEIKLDTEQHLEIYDNLNKWIDSKAKIVHLANDYGQLDVLIALQEPQRKIDSVIVSDENRAVAQTNYIVGKRKMHYWNSIESIAHKKYDVVLISDDSTLTNLETVCNLATTVILVKAEKVKNTVLSFGFEIQFETEKLVVVKKKFL
ncbi:1-acyl-sn-glycerol-3-phosphate acyltransferase [Flavobacterium taihuense]|uniref:1-acyl-sn-glycerol-3-phosphate acyltransferase n=1 Tax=Flavobacterium taihuense TaxID=2857508 RepID=A0ABS6Y1T5_9FLAO|nr:1-acyl-sn-glycerol-3-phosphate acyltransferase [Flavobacterium taihuense]MBW4362058.1 1-acyl-sn-glycerol-3-phosphate acyltransferase [Flavobacterium taihuense]